MAPIVGNIETLVPALHWPDEAATQAWATQLARRPELYNAVIELHGDLGAGKTTLVRHLLRALGVSGVIKSPSYAVVEPHEALTSAGLLSIWHFDLYRFNDPQEWEDAGLRDIFSSAGLKLIEWADNARAALPAPDLSIGLIAGLDESRVVTLRAHTAIGQRLIA